MAGLSTDSVKEADVVVCLKRKRANKKILSPLKDKLRDMFPEDQILVGMGRDEIIKLRHGNDTTEKEVRRLVWTLGGKISRRQR